MYHLDIGGVPPICYIMLYIPLYIYIFYPLHGYQALSTDLGPARLKFPVFEIINMAMTFTAFSPGVSALPRNRFLLGPGVLEVKFSSLKSGGFEGILAALWLCYLLEPS